VVQAAQLNIKRMKEELDESQASQIIDNFLGDVAMDGAVPLKEEAALALPVDVTVGAAEAPPVFPDADPDQWAATKAEAELPRDPPPVSFYPTPRRAVKSALSDADDASPSAAASSAAPSAAAAGVQRRSASLSGAGRLPGGLLRKVDQGVQCAYPVEPAVAEAVNQTPSTSESEISGLWKTRPSPHHQENRATSVLACLPAAATIVCAKRRSGIASRLDLHSWSLLLPLQSWRLSQCHSVGYTFQIHGAPSFVSPGGSVVFL
jgi:hypothetical protein